MSFPPEGPSVPQRVRRQPARPAPAGVGLHVRRLDPRRPQGERPIPLGQIHGVREGHRAVAPLDPTDPRPGRPQARVERPVRPQLDQGVRWCAVVGEPAVAEHHVGSRALHRRPLDLGPPSCEQRIPYSLAAHERGWGIGRAEHAARRVDDGLPAGATAQVCPQRRLDVEARGRRRPAGRLQGGEPHDDAGRAEPALTRSTSDERVGPAATDLGIEALEGGHVPSGDAPDGGDTRDPGDTVHPDRAAAALALGTATIFDRPAGELLPHRVEQRDPLGHRDADAVEAEADWRPMGLLRSPAGAAPLFGDVGAVAQDAVARRPRVS